MSRPRERGYQEIPKSTYGYERQRMKKRLRRDKKSRIREVRIFVTLFCSKPISSRKCEIFQDKSCTAPQRQCHHKWLHSGYQLNKIRNFVTQLYTNEYMYQIRTRGAGKGRLLLQKIDFEFINRKLSHKLLAQSQQTPPQQQPLLQF